MSVVWLGGDKTMPGRVFISCGQDSGVERSIAAEISDWFRSRGYHPYVAIQAQSIQDVNSGIIGELRRSDYYVFVDFKRERLRHRWLRSDFRGSLFTNQELAVAYVMGFENVIFLQEKEVRREGLLRYMTSNAIQFAGTKVVPDLVKKAVEGRRWSPTYSRNLVAAPLRWSSSIINYGGGRIVGRFLYLPVENRRPDQGAFSCVARLSRIVGPGGGAFESPNRSPLKVTGQHLGFSQVIWPRSYGEFDLLAVGVTLGDHVYLNTSLDVPIEPVLTGRGVYTLEYEVFAAGFEVLPVSVRLTVTGDALTATAELQEDSGTRGISSTGTG